MLAAMVDNANIHNRLILAIVNKFLAEGYKVYANHIGYPNGKPTEFKGYTPDVVAIKGEKKIIFEAETGNSLDLGTRTRWTLLSELSVKDKAKLALIVPMESFDRARKLAEEWKIKFDEFYAME